MSDIKGGRKMKKGDVFVTPDGDTIEVRRVSYAWADIKVTQPHGASWTKRQPVNDNSEFPFAAALKEAL